MNHSSYLWRKRYALGLLFLFLLLLVVDYSFRGLSFHLLRGDVAGIISFVASFGVLSALIYTFVVTLEIVIAPIPGYLIYAVGGLLFGPFLGGTLALIGNVIGAVIAFLLARSLGRDYVEKKVSKKELERFDRFFEKYGALSMFLLRLNPFTSSDVFSYLAGLTSMRLSALVIGTFFGLAPLVYITSYLGDAIFSHPLALVFFIGTAILYLVFFIYGIWYARKR